MATTSWCLAIVVLSWCLAIVVLLSSAVSCVAAGHVRRALLQTILAPDNTVSPVPAGSSIPSAAATTELPNTTQPVGASAGGGGKAAGSSPIGAYIGEAAAALVVLVIVVLVICRCYTNKQKDEEK